MGTSVVCSTTSAANYLHTRAHTLSIHLPHACQTNPVCPVHTRDKARALALLVRTPRVAAAFVVTGANVCGGDGRTSPRVVTSLAPPSARAYRVPSASAALFLPGPRAAVQHWLCCMEGAIASVRTPTAAYHIIVGGKHVRGTRAALSSTTATSPTGSDFDCTAGGAATGSTIALEPPTAWVEDVPARIAEVWPREV